MSYLAARSPFDSKPLSSTRPAEQVFTVDEVATFLKIPKATVYKLVRQKKIPAHKVGKHWRFLQDEVEDWLRQR